MSHMSNLLELFWLPCSSALLSAELAWSSLVTLSSALLSSVGSLCWNKRLWLSKHILAARGRQSNWHFFKYLWIQRCRSAYHDDCHSFSSLFPNINCCQFIIMMLNSKTLFCWRMELCHAWNLWAGRFISTDFARLRTCTGTFVSKNSDQSEKNLSMSLSLLMSSHSFQLSVLDVDDISY